MLTEDLDIYFDLDGFGSTHTIGAASVVCVKGDEISGRSALDGTRVTMFDLLVKKSSISKPAVRDQLTIDGTVWTVDEVKDDGGVYTITLSTARIGELTF